MASECQIPAGCYRAGQEENSAATTPSPSPGLIDLDFRLRSIFIVLGCTVDMPWVGTFFNLLFGHSNQLIEGPVVIILLDSARHRYAFLPLPTEGLVIPGDF
jgi:hypothetical protein